jgi:hypothetical protein
MANDGGSERDVIDVLADEDAAIEHLFEGFFSSEAAEDPVRRGSIGLELRDRIAVQDAAKQELVHATLRDLGLNDLAKKIDGRARERRRLLVKLDDMSRGVSARDVHIGQADEFDETVTDLRNVLMDHLQMERSEVIPALRAKLSPEALDKLTARVDKVRKRAPTHPKADTPLEHEGNPVTKRVRATIDHMRDFADAPHHSDKL